MNVGVLGLNFKTAGLAIRERFAKSGFRLLGESSFLAQNLSTVLLSTCNRTEVYFSYPDLAEAHTALLTAFRDELQCRFEEHLYSYFGVECFAHLGAVTAGLDSALVAESEIQRQVKDAYQLAGVDRPLTSSIHYLFQKSLKIAKEIRTAFPSFTGDSTIEGMVVSLAALLFPDWTKARVLFVGNSEINRKIFAFLLQKRGKQLALCTRGTAQDWSNKGASVLVWERLKEWPKWDIVIAATHASDYLIGKIDGDKTTQLVVDLSMPRCVDPKLADDPQLLLFNIEQISKLIEKKRQLPPLFIETARRHTREKAENALSLFVNKRYLSVS